MRPTQLEAGNGRTAKESPYFLPGGQTHLGAAERTLLSSSSGATPPASPVDSNRLRNVLITAVVRLLLTFIYLFLLTIPFFKRTIFFYAPLLLGPHLWIVWRLRKKDQKGGLEWAVGTGVGLLAHLARG